MASTTLSAQEARQQLYAIMQADATFEEKAEEALALGERYLQVENGHLTRIDETTAYWEALISTDPSDGDFPAGLALDLGMTYCRRTIEANAPIALHDATKQGWEDDPAFEEHGLRCYHGTTLIIEEERYGTICFVGVEPREDPFSESETMFAELLTRLLERELERAQHEAQLTRQSNHAAVLNRVLRHNLRNDMSVIRGYTQMVTDEIDDATYPDKALQKIDELLRLCEKARELERIVGNAFNREQTDIGELVERLVDQLDDEYPRASFHIDIDDDDVDSAILPTLERALEELLDNAAKHSRPTPTVEITVTRVPNEIEVSIADDGPGLDQQEREVVQTGIETALIHGSGLGLWITRWILTTHGGTIDARVTDDGTEMTVSIPHTPEVRLDEHVEALQRDRDLYEAAFNDALDAMFIFNDEARVVDANPAAESVYGLPTRELLGRSIADFLPDEFDFTSAWEDFLSTGASRDTVTVIGADGVERCVEYTAKSDVVPGQHFMTVRETSPSAD